MLVSFCIKCFNQEAYIAEALRGAFAQTYDPMEIVIADDASTDRSMEIIEREIAAYRAAGGRREITLVRNPANLGNVGNWQRLCEVAKGELLVKADGDDASLPERVERVVATIGDKSCLVHAAVTVDLDGHETGVFEKADGCYGAASAYRRECYDRFGPIEFSLAADDEVYLWRARMLAGFAQISERLIRYRVGSGFSSVRTDFRRRMHQNYVRTLESRRQSAVDLERICPELAPERHAELAAELAQATAAEEAAATLWSDAPLKVRFAAFCRLDHGRLLSKRGLMHRLQLLPRPLADCMCNLLLACR